MYYTHVELVRGSPLQLPSFRSTLTCRLYELTAYQPHLLAFPSTKSSPPFRHVQEPINFDNRERGSHGSHTRKGVQLFPRICHGEKRQ